MKEFIKRLLKNLVYTPLTLFILFILQMPFDITGMVKNDFTLAQTHQFFTWLFLLFISFLIMFSIVSILDGEELE